MKRVVELDLRAQGIVVDAGVNGAPLARLRGDRRASMRLPVDWWLMPEGNALTVALSPLDEGEAAPRVEVAIRDAEERQAPSVTFAWSLPEPAEFEPFRVAIPFVPLAVPAVGLWREADPVEALDDGDLAAVRALSGALLEAVSARRIDEVVARLEDRIAELAVAVDRPAAWMREATQDDLGRILLATDFVLRPVDLDALRLTPCGDGRVFHVSSAEGLELVTAVTDDEREAPPGMQVYVARWDGRWRIVR